MQESQGNSLQVICFERGVKKGMWISRKKLAQLEKRVADLEKKVQDQPKEVCNMISSILEKQMKKSMLPRHLTK